MPVHPGKKDDGVNRPDLEDVARLHAAGEGRNAIAATLRVSHRQVDNAARELGLSWSGEATREAVEARRQHAEVDRLELAGRFRLLAAESVELALVEEDPLERRRHVMTATAAMHADLSIWARKIENYATSATGGEQWAELLESIRGQHVEIMGDDGEVIGAFRTFDDMVNSSPGVLEDEVALFPDLADLPDPAAGPVEEEEDRPP